MNVARILIVDDEPLVAASLKTTAERAGHHVVGVAHGARAALDLVQQSPVDVAVIDIDLGEPLDGLDLAPVLQARCGASCVFLSGREVEASWPSRAVSLDAAGLYLKPCSPAQLEVAIALAMERRAQPALRRLGASSRWALPGVGPHVEVLADLSARQREVVLLVAEGLSVARVADRLGVSQHTVRNHLKAVFKKLGVHSQVELVARVSGRAAPGSSGPPRGGSAQS